MERFQKLLQGASAGLPALAATAGLAGAGYLASNAMYTVDAGHMSLKTSCSPGWNGPSSSMCAPDPTP
eukprot:Skav232284  [mRNA]  locus=scaffold882:291105:295033:- [translate_table: standard]